MRPVLQRVDPAAEGDADIDHQAPRVTAAFGLENVAAEQREHHASTMPQHPEANVNGYPDKRLIQPFGERLRSNAAVSRDRKSTRLNSSHSCESRMHSSA